MKLLRSPLFHACSWSSSNLWMALLVGSSGADPTPVGGLSGAGRGESAMTTLLLAKNQPMDVNEWPLPFDFRFAIPCTVNRIAAKARKKAVSAGKNQCDFRETEKSLFMVGLSETLVADLNQYKRRIGHEPLQIWGCVAPRRARCKMLHPFRNCLHPFRHEVMIFVWAILDVEPVQPIRGAEHHAGPIEHASQRCFRYVQGTNVTVRGKTGVPHIHIVADQAAQHAAQIGRRGVNAHAAIVDDAVNLIAGEENVIVPDVANAWLQSTRLVPALQVPLNFGQEWRQQSPNAPCDRRNRVEFVGCKLGPPAGADAFLPLVRTFNSLEYGVRCADLLLQCPGFVKQR